MCETLPEELLHQIMAMCHSIDYEAFAHRSPEQLFAHRKETARLLLVCQRWRRVATPLKYEMAIVTSEAEASVLATILSRGRVGSYVKKLRIEGGFGRALRTILSKVPNLLYIFISLDISSEAKVAGLCAGLKLVNPQYLVLRDRRVLGNQAVRSVVDTLITCMKTLWTNLISYDHPYDEWVWLGQEFDNRQYCARTQRARDLARALVHIPKLQIVHVPRAYYTSEYDVVLKAVKNPSVQRIISWMPWQDGFIVPLDRYPRLRDIIYLPLPGPWLRPTYAAIGQGDPASLFPTTFGFCTQPHKLKRTWSDRWSGDRWY